MNRKYTQKFVYTELAKPSLGHTEPYNLFGVIIDATYPNNKCKNNFSTDKKPMTRWMASIKLIDPSLNQKAAQILKDYKDGDDGSN